MESGGRSGHCAVRLYIGNVLSLHWEHAVALPPVVVWSYLTEPELMNRWSLAPIELVALGDGGHPGGVGALRRVKLRLLGCEMPLDEVIENAVPGKHLTYRVYAGAPVRRHTGNIEINECASGSLVNWCVQMESFVPGLELAIRGMLHKQVADSLARLTSAAHARVPMRALPPERDLDELDDFARIEARAEAVRDAQRTLADDLLSQCDARGWFVRAYEYVSDLQLEACRAGRFEHPAWVARAVIAFDPLYRRNWEARLQGDIAGLESHWARAFANTERVAQYAQIRFVVAMRSIFEGMRAHIEDDLPRALAQTYVDHYAGRVDYQRFRADYLRMAPIFADASDRLLAHFPQRKWGLRDRVLDALTIREMRTWLIDQTFYPISARRMQAFDRGARIAALMLHARNGSGTGRG